MNFDLSEAGKHQKNERQNFCYYAQSISFKAHSTLNQDKKHKHGVDMGH